MSTHRQTGRSNNPMPPPGWPDSSRRKGQQPSPSELVATQYRKTRGVRQSAMRRKIRRDKLEEDR